MAGRKVGRKAEAVHKVERKEFEVGHKVEHRSWSRRRQGLAPRQAATEQQRLLPRAEEWTVRQRQPSFGLDFCETIHFPQSQPQCSTCR